MTYELAKQLKDAGFPSEAIYCRCTFLSDEEKAEQNAKEVYDCNSERVPYPTLTELIEACGEMLDCLYAPKAEVTHWSAKGGSPRTTTWGSTPEEAVAMLYLALYGKGKKSPSVERN